MAVVNATLQAEAIGKSWLQQNHHPLESLWTLALLTAIYFVLPVLKIAPPSVPESAWITIGAMLGIRAWNAGRNQQESK
jgi:peptidoglycan/LPS O-acetylase OafA/YrhL